MRGHNIWVIAVGKRIYKRGMTKQHARYIHSKLKGHVQDVAMYRMVGE